MVRRTPTRGRTPSGNRTDVPPRLDEAGGSGDGAGLAGPLPLAETPPAPVPESPPVPRAGSPAASSSVPSADGTELDGAGCGDRCTPAGACDGAAVTVTLGAGRGDASVRSWPELMSAITRDVAPAARMTGPLCSLALRNVAVFNVHPS